MTGESIVRLISAFIIIITSIIIPIFYTPWSKKRKLQKETEKRQQADFQNRIEASINTMRTDVSTVITDLAGVRKQVYDVENGVNGIQDIRKSMAKIQESVLSMEDSQRVFLNIQKIAFWYSTSTGECIYVSPAYCRLSGYSESELIGNNWLTVIVREHRQRVQEAWETSINLSTPFDEVYTIKKPDNSTVTVHALAFHKRLEEGIIGRLELAPL